MTLLLEQQGQEISSGRGLEDHGVASEFREVQGLDSADAQAEHKKTLMESIFRENEAPGKGHVSPRPARWHPGQRSPRSHGASQPGARAGHRVGRRADSP